MKPEVWVPLIATPLAALIASVGAYVTARFVTANLERQKQRMELYKTLYNERIAASKQLMEMAGTIHQKCSGRSAEIHTDSGERIQFVRLTLDLYNSLHVNRWLLTKEVFETAQRFRLCSLNLYFRNLGSSDELTRDLEELSVSISTMMHNDDFMALFKKENPRQPRFSLHQRKTKTAERESQPS